MNGRSETTVDVALTALMNEDYAINVHKSPQEASVYVSCGDIPRMATAAAPAGAGKGAPAQQPSGGAAPAQTPARAPAQAPRPAALPRTGGDIIPLIGLAAVALTGLGVGLYARRLSRRASHLTNGRQRPVRCRSLLNLV